MESPHRHWLNVDRKHLTEIALECYELYWINPGCNISQKKQQYSHSSSIAKIIEIRRTRHAGHNRRSKDEFVSDILLWNSSHGSANVGRPTGTYLQQFCTDTGCSLEDLTEAMDDRDEWRERDSQGNPCKPRDMMMMMMMV